MERDIWHQYRSSRHSLNTAILHYQLTGKSADEGAYDARNASETDCLNFLRNEKFHCWNLYSWSISWGLSNSSHRVRKFVLAAKRLSQRVVEKFWNSFCSVHWYRQMHTGRTTYRTAAFLLLLHSSLPHIHSVKWSAIYWKSVVKLRNKGGRKLL